MKDLSNVLAPLTFLKNLHLNFYEYLSFSKKFSLVDSCEDITDKGIRHLCQALKNLVSLQNLRLNFNNFLQGGDEITGKGIKHLGEALKTLKSLKNLDLDFGG